MASQKAPTKVKRSRTNFSPAQLRAMEMVFTQSQYPDVTVLETLAKNLGLPIEKICTWFQNRRSRFRKESTKVHIRMMRQQVFMADLVTPAPGNAVVPSESSSPRSHVLSRAVNDTGQVNQRGDASCLVRSVVGAAAPRYTPYGNIATPNIHSRPQVATPTAWGQPAAPSRPKNDTGYASTQGLNSPAGARYYSPYVGYYMSNAYNDVIAGLSSTSLSDRSSHETSSQPFRHMGPATATSSVVAATGNPPSSGVALWSTTTEQQTQPSYQREIQSTQSCLFAGNNNKSTAGTGTEFDSIPSKELLGDTRDEDSTSFSSGNVDPNEWL